MKRSRFTEEPLRLADSGTPVVDVCWQLGVSEATFYTWKKKYADFGVCELRKLKQLEALVCDGAVDCTFSIAAQCWRSLATPTEHTEDQERRTDHDSALYHSASAPPPKPQRRPSAPRQRRLPTRNS